MPKAPPSETGGGAFLCACLVLRRPAGGQIDSTQMRTCEFIRDVKAASRSRVAC